MAAGLLSFGPRLRCDSSGRSRGHRTRDIGPVATPCNPPYLLTWHFRAVHPISYDARTERQLWDPSEGWNWMSEHEKDPGGNVGTGVIVQTKPKTKKPSLYKVLMLNDDYTPMEFVVHVLERFFSKTREEATGIMLHVHRRGVGVCGVFTYEVAETKVAQVMDFARRHQHPLQCIMEKA